MISSTAVKVLLVLTLCSLPQVDAHLRKTKGATRGMKVQGMDGQRILQEQKGGGNGGKVKGLKGAVQGKQQTSNNIDREEKAALKLKAKQEGQKQGAGKKNLLDAEETTYAHDESGNPLFVSKPIALDESYWSFVDEPDSDGQDGPFVIEIGHDPNQVDTEDDTIGGGEDEHVDAVGNMEATATNYTEPVDQNMSETPVGSVQEENSTESSLVDLIDEYGEVGDHLEDFFNGPEQNIEDTEEVDAEEEEEEEEEELIVNEVPAEKLENRLAEAEIQLDTLLQLGQTVKDLEEQLDTALKTIASQEQALSTLAMTVMAPPEGVAEENHETPSHITALHQEQEPRSDP